MEPRFYTFRIEEAGYPISKIEVSEDLFRDQDFIVTSTNLWPLIKLWRDKSYEILIYL